jgi:hypothetical protein
MWAEGVASSSLFNMQLKINSGDNEEENKPFKISKKKMESLA